MKYKIIYEGHKPKGPHKKEIEKIHKEIAEAIIKTTEQRKSPFVGVKEYNLLKFSTESYSFKIVTNERSTKKHISDELKNGK